MKEEIIKIALVGGGTGGHVTPLVALSDNIKTQHNRWRVVYIGAKNDKVGLHLSQKSANFHRTIFIYAGKWHRFGQVRFWHFFCFWQPDFWRNLVNFFLFSLGFWQSLFYFIRRRPNLLFSKGGYVALGPCLAAVLLKIPLVIHDSDAVFGGTHNLVKRYARLQLRGLAIDKTPQLTNQRHVGIPVNSLFGKKLSSSQTEKIFKKYKLPAKSHFILVIGGGGGARSLNLGLLDVFDDLKLKSQTYFILITGKGKKAEVLKRVKKLKQAQRLRVAEFVDDMPDLVRAALGVVSRAGATALSEISLAQKPVVIVPNLSLPRSHQLHNARVFQQTQAAWLVSDDGQQVNLRILKLALNELINDRQKRLLYQRNIAKLSTASASTQTLRAIEDVLKNKDKKPLKKNRQIAVQELVRHRRQPAKNYKKLIFYCMRVIGLMVILLFAAFKVFYVSDIKINIQEGSPLISQKELQSIEQTVKDIIRQENIFNRNFFHLSNQLNKYFNDKPYIKEMSLKRDLVSSQITVDLSSKQILGSFTDGVVKTIITDDGYAIAGYNNLVTQKDFTLNIVSPKRVDKNKIEQLILSPLDLKFLKEINIYLASEGYRLIEARISKNPREIIFRLENKEFDIIALTIKDPIEQAIALISALKYFDNPQNYQEDNNLVVDEENLDEDEELLEPIIPEEYIDVRLIDRVIYK